MCAIELQSCVASSTMTMVLVSPRPGAPDAEPWMLGGLFVLCAVVVLYGIRRSIRQARQIAELSSEEQADLISRDAW